MNGRKKAVAKQQVFAGMVIVPAYPEAILDVVRRKALIEQEEGGGCVSAVSRSNGLS